jgi:hypothetical protein
MDFLRYKGLNDSEFDQLLHVASSIGSNLENKIVKRVRSPKFTECSANGNCDLEVPVYLYERVQDEMRWKNVSN